MGREVGNRGMTSDRGWHGERDKGGKRFSKETKY